MYFQSSVMLLFQCPFATWYEFSQEFYMMSLEESLVTVTDDWFSYHYR